MKHARHREFADAPERAAAHSGSAYPDEPEELRHLMDQYMEDAPAPASHLCAIAAPHVSPEGGWHCYRDAFAALPSDAGDRTFVVLGTSHYGQPDRFGLTRKPFTTPFGQTTPALDLIDRLHREAPAATVMEDYCHAVEHSIEFQIVFLQSLFGAGVRVAPILCGSFARSIYEGGTPEDDDGVKRFLHALRELQEREGSRLCWVLGIDMAHIGRRYGDGFRAIAHREELLGIGARDRARIDAVNQGDAERFWSLVQENHDDLKWCGSAPVYTFLRAVPKARGTLRRYDQWNIDEESVVSFAAMEFREE
jgi:AmmeMemoRadiSam system protein B